ncbi:M15 family peptidase [Nocardioides seonyuensis]|uniref:M15 family peptidase n=1 Tax=Nocardioides seonyuensis TaxID=2518371 RepID=A0A4P7IDP0_9ACTN|nr:M15 family metallopeptidase [Nocardioides seonyuensis]QBX55289.1 M15 family peptidase [Nocardioides seonyuensis]
MALSAALAGLLVQAVTLSLGAPAPVVTGAREYARTVLQPRTDGTLVAPSSGLGSRPPSWLGTRELPVDPATGYGEVRRTPPALRTRGWTLPDRLPALPGEGYAARVVVPAPRHVIRRSTWRPGCPVGRRDLAWVRLAFWGFDARRHTGELLVHRTVARDVAKVFGRLYRARFPMEQVVVVPTWDPEAPPTGDGNGTGAFVCRASTGTSYFSQHAYGLAIDVNTFQNPYAKGQVLLPELASSYLRRDEVRPGMITADGPVVEAFASIGWEWGGDWRRSLDYQHFSRNGL